MVQRDDLIRYEASRISCVRVGAIKKLTKIVDKKINEWYNICVADKCTRFVAKNENADYAFSVSAGTAYRRGVFYL